MPEKKDLAIFLWARTSNDNRTAEHVTEANRAGPHPSHGHKDVHARGGPSTVQANSTGRAQGERGSDVTRHMLDKSKGKEPLRTSSELTHHNSEYGKLSEEEMRETKRQRSGSENTERLKLGLSKIPITIIRKGSGEDSEKKEERRPNPSSGRGASRGEIGGTETEALREGGLESGAYISPFCCGLGP